MNIPTYPPVFLRFLVMACLCVVSLRAQALVESFDQKPLADVWSLGPGGSVLDGELLLSAAGSDEGYPTTALVTKVGNAALNFTIRPIELTLVGVNVTGTAAPANSVFMAILASDANSEMKSRGYLKLRISADGVLQINCADVGGDRTRESVLYKTAVKLPIRRLTLRVSTENFKIAIFDSARRLEHSSGWKNEFDLAVWQDAAPYVIVKSVRRPGAGDVVATLGNLEITPVQ